MKTILLFLALVGSLCAQTQTADMLLDATGQSLGANATTAVLTASLHSTGATVAYSGANASALVVDNTITTPPFYKVKIGSTTYDLTSAVGFKFDHQYYQNELVYSFSTTSGPVSGWMLWRTNAINPKGAGANSRIDFVKMKTDSGKDGYCNYAVGGGGTPPSMRAETTLSAASGTGANVIIQNVAKVYLVTWIYTPGNPGTFTVRVYDPLTWTQVGESTRNSDLATSLSQAMFGSDAGSTSQFTGTNSWFSCCVIDLSGKFPLGVPETPGTPTNFSASVASSTSVNLSWINVDTKFQSIQILRAPHGGAFAVVGYTSDSATTYTDTGLQPGVQYDYQIRAHNILYNSSSTSTQSVTTTESTAQPGSARLSPVSVY